MVSKSCKKQRVAFFGSPEDVVCIFESLVSADFEIVMAYTRSSKRAERSGKPTSTPIGRTAKAARVPVTSPVTFDEATCTRLQALNPDIFITAAYGRILPMQILSIPRFGTLNLHPSLLPHYRGASPVAAAILDDAGVTGLTFMLVNDRLDAGDIVAQTQPFTITDALNKEELQRMLFAEGAKQLPDVLDDWFANRIVPIQQDESQATVTRILTKQDGIIDWRLHATYLARMVRAYASWPSAYTYWNENVLKVVEANAVNDVIDAGRVVFQNEGICIGCGQGALLATKLQLGSRNIVTAGDIMNGYPQLNNHSFLN